jgi:hypothetical protein
LYNDLSISLLNDHPAVAGLKEESFKNHRRADPPVAAPSVALKKINGPSGSSNLNRSHRYDFLLNATLRDLLLTG